MAFETEHRAKYERAYEDIVAEIQAGHRDKILELWDRVQWFVMKRVRQITCVHAYRCGYGTEDLKQTAFIALMLAAGKYNASGSVSFLTVFQEEMAREFAAAVGDGKIKHKLHDPVDHAACLDAPAFKSEDNHATIAEIVEDPLASARMDSVEAQYDTQALRAVLNRAMAALPDDCRQALVDKYYLGADADKNTARKAIAKIRESQNLKELEAFL